MANTFNREQIKYIILKILLRIIFIPSYLIYLFKYEWNIKYQIENIEITMDDDKNWYKKLLKV